MYFCTVYILFSLPFILAGTLFCWTQSKYKIRMMKTGNMLLQFLLKIMGCKVLFDPVFYAYVHFMIYIFSYDYWHTLWMTSFLCVVFWYVSSYLTLLSCPMRSSLCLFFLAVLIHPLNPAENSPCLHFWFFSYCLFLIFLFCFLIAPPRARGGRFCVKKNNNKNTRNVINGVQLNFPFLPFFY